MALGTSDRETDNFLGLCICRVTKDLSNETATKIRFFRMCLLKQSSAVGPNSKSSVPGAQCDAVSPLPNFLHRRSQCSIHEEKSVDEKLGKELSFLSVFGSESPQHLSGMRCRSQPFSQNLK